MYGNCDPSGSTKDTKFITSLNHEPEAWGSVSLGTGCRVCGAGLLPCPRLPTGRAPIYGLASSLLGLCFKRSPGLVCRTRIHTETMLIECVITSADRRHEVIAFLNSRPKPRDHITSSKRTRAAVARRVCLSSSCILVDPCPHMSARASASTDIHSLSSLH